MSERLQELWDAIRRDPDDEIAKQAYEEYLVETDPHSPALELLIRERELANAFRDQEKMDRLGEDYVRFQVDNYGYMWDARGHIDKLWRPFKVWLVSFDETRRFAVEQAAKYVLKSTMDLDHLPVVTQITRSFMGARNTKQAFVDFVLRYRGRTGHEAELQAHELVLAITPKWVESWT